MDKQTRERIYREIGRIAANVINSHENLHVICSCEYVDREHGACRNPASVYRANDDRLLCTYHAYIDPTGCDKSVNIFGKNAAIKRIMRSRDD